MWTARRLAAICWPPGSRCAARGRPGERAAKPAISAEVSTDSTLAKPAICGTVSTDAASPAPTRAPSASACEPYRELIVEALGRGRNAVAIWQDLVDDHGFSARYASVRRFVLKLRGTGARRGARRHHDRARRRRPGRLRRRRPDGPRPQHGKCRRTRLFVLTLGCSRKSVRLLVWRSSAQIWAELHERAFRRLGGTVRVIVLDNLKEGVLTPDIYDPALNPLYRDVLAHYGVVALPCRVGDPDRKGKVEAGVGHAQKTPLKGLRFETSRRGASVFGSLGDALGRHAHPRHDEAASRRDVCRGAARARPLRSNRFAITATANARCISMAASKSRRAYYGAPPGWIGQRVQVQWNDLHVRLLAPKTGQLLREHLRAPRGWHRLARRRPAGADAGEHGRAARPRARPPARTSARCARHIHQHDGAAGVRRMLGVLALAKKHGPAVVDDAAKAALDLGVPTYRFPAVGISNAACRCR